MSDLLVNIRVGYYHFKLSNKWYPSIEKNGYWVHYYKFKSSKPKEKFIQVYQFFK